MYRPIFHIIKVNLMNNRLEELDGLRGIASFMVFLSHAIGILAISNWVAFYQNSSFRILSDGAAAVDIFFVLSGFVLSLPYINKNKDIHYVSYCLKRLFRIYPAYWLCLSISVLLQAKFHPEAMYSLSEWSQSLWIHPVTSTDIIKHIPLIMKTDQSLIDPVIWTLSLEIKMSLILPIFIFWLKKSSQPISQILLIITTFSLSFLSMKFYYLPLFIMGLLLSQHWNKLKAINQTTKISSIVLLVSILLIGNRFTLNITNNAQVESFITGLGTMLFIPCAITFNPLSLFLKSPLVSFMGKISYSFYLYHLPFLLISTSVLYPIFHDFLIPMIISLIISMFISYISYLIIEKKSMAIFKKIEHKFQPYMKY